MECWRGPVEGVAERGGKDSFCMNGLPPASVSEEKPDIVPPWGQKAVREHGKHNDAALFMRGERECLF